MADIFRDEFVPNIEGQSQHAKWVQANPGEYAKWKAYRDACIAYDADESAPVPPTLATKYGKALVAAGKLDVSVTDLGATYDPPPEDPPDDEPPPPPTGNPYTITDYSDGLFKTPWASLFYPGSPGFVSNVEANPVAGSPDGRVSIVNDPAGSATKVARFEIRDSDPGWGNDTTLHKAEARTANGGSRVWNKSTVEVGDERWFSERIYCPWTATEKFEVSQGSNDWNSYTDFHSTFSGAVSATTPLFAWGVATNQKIYFRTDGGTYAGGANTPNYREIAVWNVTDSTGARIMANHNRWIDLMWGMRYAPDNTGWLEVWVDGVNVFPRTFRPTMWSADVNTGVYFKHGIYNHRTGGDYPVGGRTVLYFGQVRIGMLKTDVDAS